MTPLSTSLRHEPLFASEVLRGAAVLERAERSSECARRRAQTVEASLTRPCYRRGWLPDCTEAEMVAQLARVCAHLTVTPGSSGAATLIEHRCAHLVNVAVQARTRAVDVDGRFDLIVISGFEACECATQLIPAALAIAACLGTRGELVALHSLAPTHEHLHGDAIHHLLRSHLPLQWVSGDRDGEFCIDVWRRL